MQSEEQRLIDGLFQRLKQAEHSAGPRDAEVERQIQGFIQQQPAAPYYMAQSILVQEAALNCLNQQVQQLQNDVAQLKATQQPVVFSAGCLVVVASRRHNRKYKLRHRATLALRSLPTRHGAAASCPAHCRRRRAVWCWAIC